MNHNFTHSKPQRDTFKKCAFDIWKESFGEKQAKKIYRMKFNDLLIWDRGNYTKDDHQIYNKFIETYIHRITNNTNLLRAVQLLSGGHFHVNKFRTWRERATLLIKSYLYGDIAYRLPAQDTKIFDGMASLFQMEMTTIHGPSKTLIKIIDKVSYLFYLNISDYKPNQEKQNNLVFFRFSLQEQQIIKQHLKKYKDITITFGRVICKKGS